MIGTGEKTTKLTSTKGMGKGGEPQSSYKSGTVVSVQLRGKYSSYLLNRVSLDDLPEDWEPIIRQYKIPSNLTRDLIEEIGLETKHIANVLVILPLIKHITDFKFLINRKKKYVDGAQINSQVLKDFLLTLSVGTKDFLVKLERAKWIEVNHSYKVGERSKQYKIGPKFKNVDWIEVDWKENLEKFLPEILERSNIARRKEVLYDLWNRASCYFLDWRDMPEGQARDICEFTSRIGQRLRVNWSEGDLEGEVIKAAKKHLHDCEKKGKACAPLETVISTYYSDLKKLDGDGFYTILHDERYKLPTFRLFTPYTNIKKELRKFVTLDGESLTNVDVRACQVALLAILYKDTPEDEKEKQEFQFKLCTEDFYEFLAGGKFSRTDAKIMMFRVMFDKTVNQRGEIYEKFKAAFPILARRIAEEKQGNYKRVAFLMQNRESEIMIFGALSELILDKKIDCLSIHDSISCFKRDVPVIRETIVKFFFQKMGFCPEVRVD